MKTALVKINVHFVNFIIVMKSESRIQQEIFRWFWNSYCLPTCEPREIIYHVPNEGQHRLVSIGVLSGCSDLIFTFKGTHYYCEVKTPEGKQSRNQKKFQDHVEKVKGCEYFICRSLKEFQEKIIEL